MNYSVGKPGRIFIVRLEENEDLLASLGSLAEREKIRSAVILAIGNLKQGTLVCGARKQTLPVLPIRRKFDRNHEILGIGTLFRMGGKPKVHLHTALGRGREVITGCLQEKSKVFLISELVVFELLGVRAIRERDDKTGFSLLKILQDDPSGIGPDAD
jgi:hypothetical protein